MNETDLSDLLPALSAEKPHLSDAIHYPTDIEPYPFICLWAGVGAGKNTLIENIINGNPQKDFPRMTVLLISSRKSKVIETLNDKNLDASRYFTNAGNIEDILVSAPHSLGKYCHYVYDNGLPLEIYQRSLVCTNAAIETYHKFVFNPDDPTTHLWNHFDMIVWDEVHSLIMDSTFQSAPYHVMRLFKETYLRMQQINNPPRCKHLILMTGTPDPLRKIIMPPDVHLLDMRDSCRSVSPKNIHFIDADQAQMQLKAQLYAGERVVFFANHAAFPKILSEVYEIPREKIAVSFSDDDRRIKLKNACEEEALDTSGEKESTENDYIRMVNVENYLYEHNSIRPDIALFYTTSRNKEGINIEDDDIHHIYIESHSLTDIKQMAGRIRKGAEYIYIIMDSTGHGNNEHRFEQILAKVLCDEHLFSEKCSSLNAILQKFCADRGLSLSDAYRSNVSDVSEFINLIKHKFPYVEFDYFSREFRFNVYHKFAREFAFAESKLFNNAADDHPSLVSLFQKEFPNTKIHAYVSPAETGKAYVQKYLEQHPEEYHPFSEIKSIAVHLLELLGSPKRSKKFSGDNIANPNYYLHKAGFHYERRNKNKFHPNYEFCSLKPYSGKNSKSNIAA